jgi:hypothetical protein
MIGIVNEPLQTTTSSLLSDYYPNAYAVGSKLIFIFHLQWNPKSHKSQAIRSAESALEVTVNNYLHVEAMNELWGAGNPNQYLSNTYFMAYDDHR